MWGSASAEPTIEWCDRRLLSRIHRYTLNRLRAEVEPVSPADFVRFLFEWQHVAAPSKLTGIDGLLHVIRKLDGFELAAGAWESTVLPSRLDRYDASMLDMLCLTGQVGWARLTEAATQSRLVRTTPVALFVREHAQPWKAIAAADGTSNAALLTIDGAIACSRRCGRAARHSRTSSRAAVSWRDGELRSALGELVSAGQIASDGFAGLRGLIADRDSGPRETHTAGRWAALTRDGAAPDGSDGSTFDAEELVEMQARALLQRYGVVCRRLMVRETGAQPWRLLARVYRRLEARGEIRGGRFVNGMSGEQFALPEAVERLREVRRTPPAHALIVISAADPLNLSGIVTAGDRVAAVASTRIVYRDGVALAVMEGDYIRPLTTIDPAIAADVASALAGRRVPPVISGFVGRVS